MKLERITPRTVRREGGQELLNLHRHLHGLYAQDEVDKDLLEEKHGVVVGAMRQRGLIHNVRDELDERATPMRGLYLTEPHGELIWKGKKKAIAKSRHFELAGETFGLCSDGNEAKAYGYVRFHAPEKVPVGEFDEPRWFKKHRVTPKERGRWWPKAEHLWVYEVADFQEFEEPEAIEVPHGVQMFIRDFHMVRSKALDTRALLARLKAERPGDTVLVPDFLWLVGGAVEHPKKAADIDVLFRADEDGGQFAIDALSATTAVRDVIAPGKGAKLDYWWHAQGPHEGKALPLADLVLRWKEPEEREIKAAVPKLDNGEKATKPEKESSPELMGPKAEASAKFWAENWWKMFPRSGRGQFTYQHHYRGLSEEESKLNEPALLETDHSVHGDLRLTARTGDLWGFSVFLGTTADVRKAGGCRLCDLPPDDNLQGSFKLEEPKEWLDVARRKPYVSEPEEAIKAVVTVLERVEVEPGIYRHVVGLPFGSGAKAKPEGGGRWVTIRGRPVFIRGSGIALAPGKAPALEGSGGGTRAAHEFLDKVTKDGDWQTAEDEDRIAAKEAIVTKLAQKTGLPEEDVNRFVEQWAHSSNDYDMRSLTLQQDAADLFDVPLSDWQEKRIKKVLAEGGEIQKTRLMPKERQTALIKEMYQHTQEELENAGIKPDDSIRLYRGIDLGGEKTPWGNGEAIDYKGNALESWSVSEDVARDFGDIVVVDVPRTSIVSTARTGMGCLTEGEFLILGSIPGTEVLGWSDEPLEEEPEWDFEIEYYDFGN